MDVGHEEIDTRGELSRHCRTRVRRADWYILVKTPRREFLPDVVDPGQERVDGRSVHRGSVDRSDVIQEVFVTDDDLWISIMPARCVESDPVVGLTPSTMSVPYVLSASSMAETWVVYASSLLSTSGLERIRGSQGMLDSQMAGQMVMLTLVS